MSTTRTVLVMAMMITCSIAQGQTTWYVDDDNCPGPGTGAEVDPFCAIQAGIDAAGAGDEVIVALGEYFENINLMGKAITVRSTDPMNPGTMLATIINGGLNGTSVVRCNSGEGPDTVLSGFLISNGSVAFGGGMRNSNSSPTVTHCAFSGNSAVSRGGGMYNDSNSSPTVTHCTFSDNSTGQFGTGGGMYNNSDSNPTVTNCAFSGNTAHDGGGMYNDDSSPTVTDCTFSNNTATGEVFGDGGGGMCNDGSSPTVTDCTFSGNTASQDGGGMFNIHGSNPSVTNCIFSGNSAHLDGGAGGGMWSRFASSPTVTNCTFSGNSAYFGGGMNNHSNLMVTDCTFSGNSAAHGGGMNSQASGGTVTNCTFSGNSASGFGGGMLNVTSILTVTNCTFSENSASLGGGIHNNSGSPTVTNCILWGNSPDEIVNQSSAPTVTYCNVHGGYTGTGNIDVDPLFVDPDGADDIAGTDDDDLRLDCLSPSIDAGDNDAVPVGVTTDLDGNPRFVDDALVADTGNPGVAGPPVVDMGAYERPVDSGVFINVPADFATLQEAIDAAFRCDEIIVAPGTYNESINFNGKAITLHSTDPLDPAVVTATIIDANGDGTVVTCDSGEGPDTVLDGFTITGGSLVSLPPGPGGAGMLNIGSSPTVSNCTFSGNIGGNTTGGGMYNGNNSAPTVSNCTYIGNTAYAGGGMANENQSNPTVTDCTFGANEAAAGGGIYNFSSSPTVSNCTFSGNDGGGMYSDDSNPTVTHCTFSGNSASSGGGMHNDQGSSPAVTDCVFSGNSAIDGGGMLNDNSSNPTVIHCTFGGNIATGGVGGGMFNANSSFPEVTNCILWGDSPDEIANVDSSMPTVSFCDVQGGLTGGSIDGGGNIDIDPLFVDPDGADDIAGTDDDDLRLGICSPVTDAGDNDAVPVGVTTDLDGNPRFVNDASVVDTGNPGVAGPPVVDMGAFERQVDSGVFISVPADFVTIQEAIDAAFVCDGIIVAPGTYNESINFNGKAITVRSSDGAGVTILDGTGLNDSVVKCINGEGPDSVLDGFTITGGNAFNGGGMRNDGSSPTVTDCMFSGNTAVNNGGGMYNLNGGSPTVTNCTFSGNSADVGGGMHNTSDSGPTVTNSTFSGNFADSFGGGMYNDGSGPTVTNSILWDNTPDQIVGDAPVRYSNIQGGWPGEGNINADPLFVDAESDNLRLLFGSPCNDAADNTAVPGGITTDLDGNPRFVDDLSAPDCPQAPGTCGTPPIVDMGAYELQNSCAVQQDCDDQDVCTFDACALGQCTNDLTVYGDVNNSGIVDLDDVLCVLEGWSVFANCPSADIAPCTGNGIIDLDDILGVIYAFGGGDLCCGG